MFKKIKWTRWTGSYAR